MDVHMNSQTKLQKYQSTKLQMLTPTDTNYLLTYLFIQPTANNDFQR